MGYSKKVLGGYVRKMNDTIAWYARFPVESLSVCISAGNDKIGHAWNLSTAPLFTCGNCKECAHDCYDIKACIQYKNVMNARARNLSILRRNYDLYWEQIRDRIRRIEKNSKYKYFRFHVGGEIPFPQYFADMVKTARMFPAVRFWTYTKMRDIVNDYIRTHGGSKEKAFPHNFECMLSVWFDEVIDNPFRLPVFICIPKGAEPPAGMFRCPGNCDYCKEHHTGCIYGVSSYTELH